MAAYHDSTAAQRALQAATVPTLEAFEANPALLERVRSRFDQDSPPPYTSSTESESEDELNAVGLQDIYKLLDAPLSEAELEQVAKQVAPFCEAGARLFGEYEAEMELLETFSTAYLVNPMFSYLLIYRVTKPRLHILARAAVRKRWQALGVWNDNWGVINYKAGDMDSAVRAIRDDKGHPWTWEWQPKDAPLDKTHPVRRAVQLRSGLRRDECPVPPPRCSLTSQSSDSEKESFITSRPWFQFALNAQEESTRWDRMSVWQIIKAKIEGSTFDVVRARWEKHGIWKREWDRIRPQGKAGWKWHHEDPAPVSKHYVDLIRNLEHELSQSELEEYESIGPTVPSTHPSKLWGSWDPEEEEDKARRDMNRVTRDPIESPPRYQRTAPKPKPAKKSAPRRQIRSSSNMERAPHKKDTPSEPRRSSRIADLEAKKQKELEDQLKEQRREQKPARSANGGGRRAPAAKKAPAKKSTAPKKPAAWKHSIAPKKTTASTKSSKRKRA